MAIAGVEPLIFLFHSVLPGAVVLQASKEVQISGIRLQLVNNKYILFIQQPREDVERYRHEDAHSFRRS